MQTLRKIPYYGTLTLLAYMPFHIFLTQSLSLLTGGLAVWKVGKDIVTIALLFLVVSLVLASKNLRRNQPFHIILVFAAVYAVIHIAVYLLNRTIEPDIVLLASAYNNRLLWYVLIGAGSMLLADKFKPSTRTLIKIVLTISTIVCLLGLLQWLLPKDILTHVGYSTQRGVKPSFFINENPAFPRVMSTVRDPNSLGAFLLVPLLILVQLLWSKQSRRRTLIIGLLMLHGLVLLLTFSRAAWAGILIALGLLFFMSHREKVLEIAKQYWPVVAILALVICLAGYSVRDTQFVRSVVFRINDTNPASELDSDQYHLYFIEKGIEGAAKKPLGHGPGTAGIVSIQNKNGSFLTENYYVQLAHEVGVLGLMVFLAAWLYIIWLLIRSPSALSAALVASAGAYAVMAMAMHLWSNEAVAAQWWLLAGLLIGVQLVQKKEPDAIIQPRSRTKREA